MITTILWPYELNSFEEFFNEIKVDDGGITPMENFPDTTTYITSKNITHGNVQFMSWMQYLKETYLDYPSGKPTHVQGYILVTNHFMQDQ